ncbi:hypothetical protein ACVHYJ_25445 [Burkholderia pyrrocinia]
MVDEDRAVAGNECAGIEIPRCTGARIAARACRTDTVRNHADEPRASSFNRNRAVST